MEAPEVVIARIDERVNAIHGWIETFTKTHDKMLEGVFDRLRGCESGIATQKMKCEENLKRGAHSGNGGNGKTKFKWAQNPYVMLIGGVVVGVTIHNAENILIQILPQLPRIFGG